MVAYRMFIFGMVGLLLITAGKADDRRFVEDAFVVGHFSDVSPGEAIPAHWERLTFSSVKKQTRYRMVRHQGAVVVAAQSQGAASGLIRYLNFDVEQYPWLTWRWHIEHVLEKGDLRTKRGDDYAARVYVAFEFEPERASWWQRTAHAIACRSAGRALPGTILTYIWANRAPEGMVVDSAYADQAKMVVLQSGNVKAGQWIVERRNIAEDYQHVFGRQPPPAMGIAIMTDTDDTGESTSAQYGDIILLPKG